MTPENSISISVETIPAGKTADGWDQYIAGQMGIDCTGKYFNSVATSQAVKLCYLKVCEDKGIDPMSPQGQQFNVDILILCAKLNPK